MEDADGVNVAVDVDAVAIVTVAPEVDVVDGPAVADDAVVVVKVVEVIVEVVVGVKAPVVSAR